MPILLSTVFLSHNIGFCIGNLNVHIKNIYVYKKKLNVVAEICTNTLETSNNVKTYELGPNMLQMSIFNIQLFDHIYFLLRKG